MNSNKDRAKEKKNIPPDGDVLCTLCGEKEEDTSHFFFNCIFSTKVWSTIHGWVGVTMVTHKDPYLPLLQHGAMFETSTQGNIASSIWMCTTCSIWRARNEKLFENIEPKVKSKNLVLDSSKKIPMLTTSLS